MFLNPKEFYMKKKFVFAAVLAALALTACKPAAAADFSYVGAQYTTTDARAFSAGGYKVEGSLELTDKVFVQAAFRDGFDRDLSDGTVKLGVGLHDTITDSGKVDAYGIFSTTVVVDDRKAGDKYGFEVEGGLKTQLAPKWELTTAVVAANLREQRFEDVKYFGKVGVEYRVTKTIALGAGVLAKDGFTEGQLGARWYF